MKDGSTSRRKILLPLLSLIAALVTVLLVEGALSLFARRSLRPEAPFVDVARLMQADARRMVADAEKGAGALRVHEDPRVGYVLRQGADVPFLDSAWSVDRIGLRARPSGPAPEGALRVAVLGDSIAFGVGVGDDETIAVHLERVLNELRSPDARPIACFTVAAPSWNTRNATSFLVDHFDEINPDIVVYIPVNNDLTDTGGVYESGHRRVSFDPFAEDPLLRVDDTPRIFFEYLFAERVRAGEVRVTTDMGAVGVIGLTADLSRESSRRYDENADAIVALHERLARDDRRLLLLHHSERQGADDGYGWVLRERLLDREVNIPEVRGLLKLVPSLQVTESDKMHPNSDGCLGLAIFTAERLAELEWIDAGGALSEFPAATTADLKSLRAPARTPEEVRARAAAYREQCLAAMQPAISIETARGSRQIYGGLNPDGTLGPRLLAVLRPSGATLTVKLAPLTNDPVYGQVEVAVEVDGVSIGSVAVPSGAAGAVVTGRFELPAGDGSPIEVRLTPDHFKVSDFRGKDFVASCRLLEISAAD